MYKDHANAGSGRVSNAMGLIYNGVTEDVHFIDQVIYLLLFCVFSDLCLHSQQALGLKLKRVGWLYGGGLRTLAGTSLGAGYADGNALNAQFSATGVPGVVIRPSISAWVISDSV